MFIFSLVSTGAGTGQPVNGAIPSLPSPTMPTFNMAAQTPNGQPGGTEAVYTNGIPQTYPAREYCVIYPCNLVVHCNYVAKKIISWLREIR